MQKRTVVFFLLLLTTLVSTARQPVDAQAGALVVISQVYGGGGNTGAPYRNDFVELFNRGTVAVNLSGWSVQYASATGTGNFGGNPVVALIGTLQPGQYYLVQLSGGTAGVPLPAADATGTIGASATAGKFVLVASTTGLTCNGGSTPCSPAQLALIRDLVGYGGANFFEGASAAPTLNNTTGALRRDNGCQDTNNNGADFTAVAPAPRNTSVIGTPCGSTITVGGAATPNPIVAGNALTITATVSPAALPPSTDVTVVANLLPVGGAAATSLFDDGIAPDAAAGDNVFTTQLFVPANTAPGSKSIAATASDAEGRAATTSIAVVVEEPPVIYLPHDIQGADLFSPKAGLTVTVEGVVTARRSNGFFIQTATSAEDADADTSEGLFVFTGSPVAAAASVGALVRATGRVDEFAGDASGQRRTNLAGTVSVTGIGSAPVPDPVALAAADLTAGGGLAQLERVEGMRVLVDLTSVAPTDGFFRSPDSEATGIRTSNGVFYAVIAGTARPVREPGLDAFAAVPPCAAGPCAIPVFDTNPERLFVDSDALGGTPLDITSGVSLPGVTGIVDSGFGEWTLLPEPGGVPTVGPNMAPVPARAPAPEEFTIASFNMERFYDTVNAPGVSDVALDPANLARRLAKASQIIRTYLHGPDILGVQEVENLATLQAIADRVNADAGTPGDYVAYLEEGLDVGGIDVGFLVRSSRVAVSSVAQYGADATFINPDNGEPALLNDRPPLVLRAVVNGPAERLPAPVTVIVNHLRSLNDVDTARVQAKRLAQAEYLAQLLVDLQAEGVPVVSVGDYNAFEVNDGYVDSMGIIRGTQAPANEVVRYSSVGLDPDMTRAVDTVEDYSYVFDGNIQNLDHVLYDARAGALFGGLSHARVNADFPEVFRNDESRPERLSDHDPAVAYFTFPPDTTAPALTLPAGLTQEADTFGGAVITFSASAVDDNRGQVFPVACAPPSGSLFAVGVTTVTCAATDLAGNTATASFPVTITDSVPPVIGSLAPDSGLLWPPNHRMVPIQLTVSASDVASPVACSISAASSSEPDNGLGDGDTVNDIVVDGPLSLSLRAERAGTGGGRIYTITVRCTDLSGNGASAETSVAVPKSQK